MPRIAGPVIPKNGATRTFRTESRLKSIRLYRGWSQMRLAGLAQTSNDIVRKAERGEILNLSVGIMIRLAQTLDVGVADLFPILAARATRPRGEKPRDPHPDLHKHSPFLDMTNRLHPTSDSPDSSPDAVRKGE